LILRSETLTVESSREPHLRICPTIGFARIVVSGQKNLNLLMNRDSNFQLLPLFNETKIKHFLKKQTY
jgi:hypothetical protein